MHTHTHTQPPPTYYHYCQTSWTWCVPGLSGPFADPSQRVRSPRPQTTPTTTTVKYPEHGVHQVCQVSLLLSATKVRPPSPNPSAQCAWGLLDQFATLSHKVIKLPPSIGCPKHDVHKVCQVSSLLTAPPQGKVPLPPPQSYAVGMMSTRFARSVHCSQPCHKVRSPYHHHSHMLLEWCPQGLPGQFTALSLATR